MRNGLLKLQSCEHRFSLHGHAVRVACDVPAMNWPIHASLGDFNTPDWPDGFTPIPGSIQPYDQSVVMRHLSPQAVPVASGDELMELYEHGERFWLVDDRWGLCEVNLLKGEWISWIVPQPRMNGLKVADAAVLWPLAQLLPHKGLTLVPAISICRAGFGALIIGPYSMQPELEALIAAGWSVIGQRWTALREEDGQVSMLHLPGAVERNNGRQPSGSVANLSDWIDLTADNPAARAFHGFCDAVVLIDAARRGSVAVKPVRGAAVASTLKRAWPIFEIRNQPRAQHITSMLAAQCTVYEAHLARRPTEFVIALDRAANSRMPRPRKIQPQVMPMRDRQQIPA